MVLSAGEFNNPLDLLDLVVTRRGWQAIEVEDCESLRVVVLKGNHGVISVIFNWDEAHDYVRLSFHYEAPPSVPDWALSGLCELTNLMNDRSQLGRFVYLDGDEEESTVNRVGWRYEIPTALIGDDGDETLSDLLDDVQRTYDSFYPVVTAFFLTKPIMVSIDGQLFFRDYDVTPHDAIEHLAQTTFVGRA